MRKTLRYLNSLKYLSASNTKEEVHFYLWNYEIAPRPLKKLIPKGGMSISKSDGLIKEKLADLIRSVEGDFALSFAEFLTVCEVADQFKSKNVKTSFYIAEAYEGELHVYFDKIKASEKHVLNEMVKVVKSKDSFDVLSRYVNNEKFSCIPYRREKDPKKKDYASYLEDLFQKV